MMTFRNHDDVIKWKHFPRYWPFVRGIHRSTVNSTHKGRWHGVLMFSLICTWINVCTKQSWGWWSETLSRSLWCHCIALLCSHMSYSITHSVKWRSAIPNTFLRIYKFRHSDFLKIYVDISGRLYGLAGARRSSRRVHQSAPDTPRMIGSVTSVWQTHWSLQCLNKSVNMSKT